MDMTRKNFLFASTAFAATLGRGGDVVDGLSKVFGSFKARDYAGFRKTLRAFFPPGYCRKECQDPVQVEKAAIIRREMIAWSNAHPNHDALDARRECYMLMRQHFYPILFPPG